MMGKIRDLTKWILYILIIAFVALMVVEWGADYTGIIQQQESVVGVVEGEEISLQRFNFAVSNARAMEEQRSGANLDEEAMSELRDRVWDELVQRIVLQKELDKLGIQVTDDDVSGYILNMLTQQYRNDPNFQTNGQFDPVKLNTILTQQENRNLLINMELQARQDLPYAKLVDFINASVIVTEQEVRDEFAKNNVKAKIDFVGVVSSVFRNDSVSISDEELQRYYNDNREDYKIEERRRIKYVFFPKTATPEDSARVREVVNQLKAEAEAGKDFNELATIESEDPSAAQNGGDLGYFDKSTMVKEFTDAAFSAEPGTIVGPVRTSFGLHIIKVEDKKVEDGVEKVKASHILKKFDPSVTTIDNANAQATAFATALEDQAFEVAADAMGLTANETPAFAQNRNGQIPGIGRIRNAMSWIFSAEEGTVSEVFYTDNGNYVFMLDEVLPAGYRPLEEVKNIVQQRVKSQKHMEMAKAYIKPLTVKAKSATDFKPLAEGDPKITADTTAYFTKGMFVPKIGRAPVLIAKAFTLPIGQVSDLIETDRGYYFIRVKDRQPFDEEAYAAEKVTLRNRLLQQKVRSAFSQWYNTLRDDATVVDQRYRFYRG